MLGPVGLLLAGPAALVFGAHAALIATGALSLATTAFALCFAEVRRLRARTLSRADLVEAA